MLCCQLWESFAVQGKLPRWPGCSNLPMQLSGFDLSRAIHSGSLCFAMHITELGTYAIYTYLKLSSVEISFIQMGPSSFCVPKRIVHLSVMHLSDVNCI